MVIGASWNGARAFTSTSGPGISLMNELLGLAYYAEIPAVVIDVQRVGPSTGMPTRTQQGDLLRMRLRLARRHATYFLLFPANPAECFELRRAGLRSGRALPDAGLPAVRSRHRHERLGGAAPQWDDSYRPDRGRVLSRRRSKSFEKFHRLRRRRRKRRRARTLPGVHPKAAYFTRGSGHNNSAATPNSRRVSGGAGPAAQEVRNRREVRAARRSSTTPRAQRSASSLWAAAIRAVREALDLLAERGVAVDFMRVRGFPFSDDVERFPRRPRALFVVEQNRDAQLRSLLTLETSVEKTSCARSWSTAACRSRAAIIVDGVLAELQPRARAAPDSPCVT